MINQDIHLNPEALSSDVKRVSNREGFGLGLVELGEKDDKVVTLTADLRESVHVHLFAEKFRERFVEVGVAEQNMASVAAGLAHSGLTPFMSSYAIFSPGRNWEQIRTNICYNNEAVKIVSTHAGLTVGPDGGSHQMLEDIALMRALPRMTIISPVDSEEARKAVIAAAEYPGPVYIRLEREKSPIITTEQTPFEIGKAQVVYNPTGSADIVIIATGHTVHTAMKAAARFYDQGTIVKVVNLSTIKPLDEDTILKLAQEARAIVTVEDHQIAGGMGSAVAEFLSVMYPVPIEFVGIKNEFGQSGKPEELYRQYGIDEGGIIAAIKKVLDRKNT